MWYEILPSAGIVFALLAAPSYFSWGVNKLFHNGKSCGRDWEASNWSDWHGYLRDRRLTGSEYVPRGLESISEDQ